jgi:hypothetical protein
MTRILAAALVLLPATAHAHFVLEYPEASFEQNILGDPQKDTPCGGEGGSPTGIVTQLNAGETITLRWRETIYHPGHWRIALSDNTGDFFDPTISLDGNQVSTGATITDPPVAPIIADNLFPRTAPNGQGETFEYDITLPTTPCASCTIQVMQFMLGHGPPNYMYFHCANIEIVGAPPPPDAGTPMDAMTPLPDADVDSGSAQEDAAVAVDTGVAMDAAPRDMGTAAVDAGTMEEEDDGCTCVRRADAGGYALLLLLSLLFMARRRD